MNYDQSTDIILDQQIRIDRLEKALRALLTLTQQNAREKQQKGEIDSATYFANLQALNALAGIEE